MDNKHNKATEIMREEKITSHDIATEILPLLKDFFCGEFTAAADTVTMAMKNGQQFKLSVSEVV